jgi:hypothetical protein
MAIDAQREIIKTFLTCGLDPRLKSAKGKSVMDSTKILWIREMLSSAVA